MKPYRCILENKRAYIVDEEGIRYMELLPCPDGDNVMTKEGCEIILDKLKISRGSWEEVEEVEEVEDGWEIGLGIDY